MNYIQRGWLRVLSPAVTLVNDKIAKRSGALGKLGKFFAFGPRQNGYHPINIMFEMVNKFTMRMIPLLTHRHSLLKNINGGGTQNARPFQFYAPLGTIVLFSFFYTLLMPSEFEFEEGTTLTSLSDYGLPTHYSFLNDRVSAHYTEINSLYHWEMLKRFDEKQKQILRKRESQPDRVKRTRFARPGYEYIEPHTKAVGV